MELKEIKLLIDLMTKNDLSVLKIEREGFKLTLKKSSAFAPEISVSSAPHAAAGHPAPLPMQVAAPAPVPAAAPPKPSGKEITSPMVGTFYRSPSAEAAPFVDVGQEVSEDTVVCIIEAMKVMNEIKAELRGVIEEVLVESGKPVQFGQPLFRVR